MRDMFDEFMDELRRRQAEQRRQNGQPDEPSGDDGDDNGDDKNADRDAEKGADKHADESHADDEDSGSKEPPRHEPGRRESIRGYGGRRPGDDDDFEERFRRFGGRMGGPPRGAGPGEIGFSLPRGRTIAVVAVIAIIVLVLALGSTLIEFATDAIWYQSVGFSSVFWTRIGSQALYFAIGTLIGIVVLWLDLWIAGRLAPLGPRLRFSMDDVLERMFEPDAFEGRVVNRRRNDNVVDMPSIRRPIAIGLGIAAVIVALSLGGALAGSWETIQLWIHRVPFGANEPTFGRDIGFFVFELPFLRLLQSFAFSLALIALVLAGVRYMIAALSGTPLRTMARLHLGLLAGLMLVLIAAGYQLDKLELVYGDHGVFAGVNYTDANARFMALDALTIIAAFAGAFLVFFAYSRSIIPLGGTVLVWFLALVILSGLFPFAVQRFVVDPNTQNQEAPYAQKSIAMTRMAFGLDKWQVQPPYNPAPTVTQAALNAETATVANVRLWDITPLEQSFDQTQGFRAYYRFPDVDTDRYRLGSDVRQVMLAGRLFNADKFAQQSTSGVTWVNQHINYTHGIGLTMVPVRDVGSGGNPSPIIQNLPPVSSSGAPKVTEPRIYFSDQETDWVVVDTRSPEFDLANSGGQETTTSWTGHTGIRIDNGLVRLLFSARFSDFNLLITDQITAQSQILFRRSITERAQLIAPFLRFDKDPYLVVTADGRLDYMLDGYTVTDRFPSSQSYDPGTDSNANGLAGSPFNYVRNSVKVVMDAYDGTMNFYVSDPNDPLIKAWESVFPGVFTSLDSMPADLKAHIRYPEDLFNAQTTQYERYHVTDPIQFQQSNDVWSVPRSDDQTNQSPAQLGMEAYYVQMRLPNDPNPEFLLLTPMVLNGRPNMISWVAARNDPGHYGQVVVYDFPSDTTTFGPVQLQGLIRQNQDISQQITLWDQAGSRVIMGNLLVIPLQDTLLYIEPVYLQAQQNALPQLARVVVATPSQVVWGTTLQDALNQILAGKGTTGPGGNPGPSPSGSPSAPPSTSPSPSVSPSTTPSVTPSSSGTPLPTDVQALVAEANRHYQLAQEALARGDFATYGAEMKIVQQLLQQLQHVVGTPPPATASPAP